MADSGSQKKRKRKTKGLHPKVPATALSGFISYLLVKLGLDADPEVAAAIATVVGFVVGIFAPHAEVVNA